MDYALESGKTKQAYDMAIIDAFRAQYGHELSFLVGDGQKSPENYGKNDRNTYGAIYYPEEATINYDNVKEWNRTILGLLLFHYLKDGKYENFIQLQKDEDFQGDVLSKESFEYLSKFMIDNFDTKEKESLLLYYMVINDLGKSQKVKDILSEYGIVSENHDRLLSYLVSSGNSELIGRIMPGFYSFNDESKQKLIDVLSYGINVGQCIQGECPGYMFNNLESLSLDARLLMFGEAILDIGGVNGHGTNFKGTSILTESMTENFITAVDAIETCSKVEDIYDTYLAQRANMMQIQTTDLLLRKAITRICLMMRLFKKEDFYVVENEIFNNRDRYAFLINELNKTGYEGEPAILLYYAPSLLSNAKKYYSNNETRVASENPIVSSLKICLPFMQNIMMEARMKNNSIGNGIMEIMLEKPVKAFEVDPKLLFDMKLSIINEYEGVVKKPAKVLMFSHVSDIDGLGAVVLAQLAFGTDDVDYVLVNDPNNLREIVENKLNSGELSIYDMIFITDLALKDPTLNEVAKSDIKDKIQIFDHHQSAIADGLDRYPFTTIIEKFEDGEKTCGTSLFYDYLVRHGLIQRSASLDKFVEMTRIEDNLIYERYGEFGEKAHNLALLHSKEENGYISAMRDKLKNNPEDFTFTKKELNLINSRKEEIHKYLSEILNNMVYMVDEAGNKFGTCFIDYAFRNDVFKSIVASNKNGAAYLVLVSLDKGPYGRKSYRALDENVDVGEIARCHGGGGHVDAAGVGITAEQRAAICEMDDSFALEYLVNSCYKDGYPVYVKK